MYIVFWTKNTDTHTQIGHIGPNVLSRDAMGNSREMYHSV